MRQDIGISLHPIHLQLHLHLDPHLDRLYHNSLCPEFLRQMAIRHRHRRHKLQKYQ
jgi:hypothetical protein